MREYGWMLSAWKPGVQHARRLEGSADITSMSNTTIITNITNITNITSIANVRNTTNVTIITNITNITDIPAVWGLALGS